MPGDADRGSRRAQEGTAVSSGESSAATPQPALNSDDMMQVDLGDLDVMQAGAAHKLPGSDPQQSPPPRNQRDSADDATLVETREPREGSLGSPNPVYA